MAQKLTEKERITLLMIRGFGDRTRSYDEVQRVFNNFFHERPQISKSTVERTVRKFQEEGTVKDLPRTGRPKSATTPEKTEQVLLSFVEEPSTSLLKACQVHEISKSSVHRILQRNNYFPYKFHLVQELNEDDFDRRLEFCEIMREKCDGDRNFLLNIVFSDEATFYLNGKVNRHNCRYWADENQHLIKEDHTQTLQKINVWAGIMGDRVIGPFFINGNLNGGRYLELLENQVVPSVRAECPNGIDNKWFQQDGAPPHFSRAVRDFLSRTFPNRWIGRRGEIEWPPRSPDLTPLDFFFWGFLKSRVYATNPETINDLQNRILEETTNITRNMLQRVQNSIYERLGHCEIEEGRQFENLL